ncbi:MAG: RHS repeat-associated core domain-containing protein [Verrucomicrobiota bacterium]
MNLRRLLTPAVALVFSTLSSHGTTNPYGYPSTDDPGGCIPCQKGHSGESTGATDISSPCFDWGINLGLARYPKPANYTGIGATAYERNGNLPTFRELVDRYFPSSPLQQSQIPLRINQTQISAATFHPSCLTLNSEALFETLHKWDINGDYIYQIVTDDAFTQVDILADGATPVGFGAMAVGAGWQIRVWKKPPPPFSKSSGPNSYYTAPDNAVDIPLTNAVICRPQGVLTSNTLLFILKETKGVTITGNDLSTASAVSKITTRVIAQTVVSGLPTQVISSLYDGAHGTVPTSKAVSRETLLYTDRGAMLWDSTILRTTETADLAALGNPGDLRTTASTREVYRDFSPTAPGGEPGMKRLMSVTEAYSLSGQTPATTSFEYYREPFLTFANGRRKSIVRPNGSWTAWEYSFGTIPIITEYSSWLNTPMSDMHNARKSVTTIAGTGFTTETYVSGQLVAKSQTSITNGQTVTESQYCGTELHTTTTTYYPDSDSNPLAAGRVKSIARPDGVLTTYSYSGVATDQIVTEATGATSNGIVSDGTTTQTHYNSGNIATSQTVMDIASGLIYTSQEWTAGPSFDPLGRPLQRNYVGNTQEVTVYSCCGLAFHRARDGSATTYSRDTLGRVYRETFTFPSYPDAITSILISTDASSHVTTTTRTRTILSTDDFLGSTTTSLDGLTTISVEPARNVAAGTAGEVRLQTRTQISSDGLTTTQSHSGNGTTWTTDSTTIRYPDGQTSSFTGPEGTESTFFYYSPHPENGGGIISSEVSSWWSLWTAGTYHIFNKDTYKDALGRTFRISASDSGQTTYNYCTSSDPAGSFGKLKTVTDADLVATTYGYSVKGDPMTTSRAVPGHPVLDAVQTRVIGVGPTVHGTALGGCAITTQTLGGSVVAGNRQGATLVSTTYNSLDGLRSATVTPAGATLTITVRPDAATGVASVTTTHPDGTKTRVTNAPVTTGEWSGGRTVLTEKLKSDTQMSLVASSTSTYDTRGRLVLVHDSRTGDTAYSDHTESGQPTVVTDPANRTTTYGFDIQGRTVMVDARVTTNPVCDNITRTSYWPSGLVKAVWGDRTYPTVSLYDGHGRITELRTFRNWPHTNGTAGPDENTGYRDVTKWTYDSSTGLLYQKYYQNSRAFTYTYTAAGRLRTRVSGRNITTTYGYTYGFPVSVAYSDPSSQTATPNLTYTYDSYGRLYQVLRGLGTNRSLHTQYNYDGVKLTSEELNKDTAVARTLTRTYQDLPNRLPGYRPDGYWVTEGEATYGANWSFDTAGRPSSITDGTDYFNYDYRYKLEGGLHTARAYGTDEAGFESDIPFGINGPMVNVSLAYETTRNVLVSRANASADSSSMFAYAVNAIGQREGVATTGSAFGNVPADSNRAWTYDTLGQLVSSTSTGSDNRAYSYDSIGNRTAAQADASAIPSNPTTGTTTYAANAANQYSSITVGAGGAMSPVYDADGNMTSGPVPGAAGLTVGINAPTSANLKWDAENRLIEATVGGTIVSYDYDYLGRLIARAIQGSGVATHYLYDGWNRIAEYSGSDLAKIYTWGLDISGTQQGAGGVGGLLSVLDMSSNSLYYPTYDGNGNVSEYIDINGGQAAHFEYDPFGNLTVDTGGCASEFPFRFSTKPQDPVTGLYYYGYRYYDPLTGRWPSRDPIGERGGKNLYGFINNMPTMAVDKDGQFIWIPFLIAAIWIALEEPVQAPTPDNPNGPSSPSLPAMVGIGIVSLCVPLSETDVLAAAGWRVVGECANLCRCGKAIEKSLDGIVEPSANMLRKYSDQLARDGARSVERSYASLARRLEEHVEKLKRYKCEGGYVSSVEKEIQNYKAEMEAIRRTLGL